MSMLKGFIFDMDGTITLATEPLHFKAYAEVFRGYGIEYTLPEHLTKYAGAGAERIVTGVFQDRGKNFDVAEIEAAKQKKRDLYKKIIQEEPLPLVPGVKEFIKKVDGEKLKKIIATGNSDRSAVEFILKKVGLLEYFPDILLITEVSRGKPFPDVFLEAVRRLGLHCQECVVFEDSINGVTASKAAGISCIALETTTSKEELLSAGATKVVKDFTEVTDEMLQEIINSKH